MSIVLPSVAVALVLGASLPALTSVSLPPLTACVATGAMLAVAVAGSPQVRLVAVVAAVIPAIAGIASIPGPPALHLVDGEQLFVGRVIEGPRPGVSGAPFVVRVLEVRTADGALLVDACARVRNVASTTLPRAGDRIVVRGEFRAPESARHPWAWNPAASARRTGVHGAIYARGEVLFAGASHPATRWLDRARLGIERLVVETLDDPERGVVLAILTGSRGALDASLREQFAATGAAHVLAVSGLHLGLVVLGVRGALVGAVRRHRLLTRRFGARRVAAALTLPVVVAYVALTGAPESACRAGWMTGALLAAELADRRASGRHALALAVAVLVAWDPCRVADVGFQLSVAATVGLVEMRRFVDRRVVSRLWASLYASTVASVVTAPVLAWHFGVVPLASPITNLVVVPPIALVALPVSALAAVVAPVWPAGGAVALRVAGLAVHVGVVALGVGGDALAASWTVGRPGPGALVAFVLLGVGIVVARGRIGPGAASIGLALLIATRPGPAVGVLVVRAVPVGHGDAIDLSLPNGERWLVDGGTGSAARRYVVPWLRAHGVGRLGGVIVTHGDRDHAEGAVEVVARFRPRVIWVPEGADGRAIRDLIRAGADVGSHVVRLRGGVCADLGGAAARLVAEDTDDNDGGIVAHVCHGAVCTLLTGDIEAPRERALLTRGVPRATWLKVAHHGSMTSSTPAFLDAVRPAAAIMTAEPGTRVGAHPEVLARLRRRGIATWVVGVAPANGLATDGVVWWTCPVHTVPRRCVH